MPPANTPADDAVLAELRAVRELLAREPPQLLTHDQAAAFVGVSRSAWFRLAGSDSTPKPITVPGVGPRFRCADLVKWVGNLKVKRCAAKPVAVVE